MFLITDTNCQAPVPVNVCIVLPIWILIWAFRGVYTHALNVYVVDFATVIAVVTIPSTAPMPAHMDFRLLVPLCACSFDEDMIVFDRAMNPAVLFSVSVPVCWLGVSDSW